MMQFVQWLSKKLKVTPDEVVQMLNKAPEEEVKKYTDLFLAETTQETGKFKSGGKINAAVAKFQNGGEVEFEKWLNDIGFESGWAPWTTDEELRLQYNDMRRRYMKETGKKVDLDTTPASNRAVTASGYLGYRYGTTEPRSFTRERIFNGYNKPDTWEDNIYFTYRPNDPGTKRIITESDTTFIDPKGRKFTKSSPFDNKGENKYDRFQHIWRQYGIYQDGGNLTRREALDAFMANSEGAARADARRALRSAKMSFDNNNLDGNRNQFARSIIAGQDYIPQENTNVYDRVGARESKKAIGGYDTNGHILNRGDQNVLMKKAKAANVEGFNENMYDFDPNQEFDRQNYRDRKRYAKENFDYMTRRQRKAYALMDRVNPVSTQQIAAPESSVVAKNSIFTPDSNTHVNATPASVTKVVGERTPINIEGVPASSNFENYTRRAEKVRRDLKYNPVSFDQFAGLLDDSMLVSDALRNGMNSRAFQVHRANEYLRYKNDPLNYIYRQMDANYGKSAQMLDDEKRARQMGILANNRGTGYYDPNDKSFESVSLFKDKTAQQMWDESGAGKEYTRYYWTDSKGNRLTDEQAQALDMMQEARGYTVPTSGTAPKIGQASGNAVKINQVPESTWHKPLAYAGMTTFTLPAMQMVGGAQGIRSMIDDAAEIAGKGTNMFKNYLQSIYGQNRQLTVFGNQGKPVTGAFGNYRWPNSSMGTGNVGGHSVWWNNAPYITFPIK